MICEQCRQDKNTRPWGPNRTNICQDCAWSTPEMKFTVEANRQNIQLLTVAKGDEKAALNALTEMRYTTEALAFQGLLLEVMPFLEKLVPALFIDITNASIAALMLLPTPDDRIAPSRSPSRELLIASIALDIAIGMVACTCPACKVAVKAIHKIQPKA